MVESCQRPARLLPALMGPGLLQWTVGVTRCRGQIGWCLERSVLSDTPGSLRLETLLAVGTALANRDLDLTSNQGTLAFFEGMENALGSGGDIGEVATPPPRMSILPSDFGMPRVRDQSINCIGAQ